MLLTKHCQECDGDWIPGDNYKSWRSQHIDTDINPAILTEKYNIPHNSGPLDDKTVPCPNCRRILGRAKIPLKDPFYLEHCLTCGGIWCDRGEWEILEQLNLHTNIPKIFSSSWQAKVRASHQIELERQAVVEKVGAEMAQRVFDLADMLTKDPNGDFAAAYLMRRFRNL